MILYRVSFESGIAPKCSFGMFGMWLLSKKVLCEKIVRAWSRSQPWKKEPSSPTQCDGSSSHLHSKIGSKSGHRNNVVKLCQTPASWNSKMLSHSQAKRAPACPPGHPRSCGISLVKLGVFAIELLRKLCSTWRPPGQ